MKKLENTKVISQNVKVCIERYGEEHTVFRSVYHVMPSALLKCHEYSGLDKVVVVNTVPNIDSKVSQTNSQN